MLGKLDSLFPFHYLSLARLIHRSSRVELYSWAQVSRWLADNRLGDVDQVAAETAVAAAEIDALLRARQILREAPTAQREALAKLVDA